MTVNITFLSEDIEKSKHAACFDMQNDFVGCTFASYGDGWWERRHFRRRDVPFRESITIPDSPDDDAHFAYEYRFVQIGEEDKTILGMKCGTEPILSCEFVGWIDKDTYNKRCTWCAENNDEKNQWVRSRWNDIFCTSFEQRDEICQPCPLRPYFDNTCYVDFSSYPHMMNFKIGMVTVLLGEFYLAIDEDDKFFNAWNSLEMLSRNTKVDLSAENFFNAFLSTLGAISPDTVFNPSSDFKIESLYVDNEKIPHIEKMICYLVYRENPYSIDEMQELLPILQTIVEMASKVKSNLPDGDVKENVQFFEDRLARLAEMFNIGIEYGIRVRISW